MPSFSMAYARFPVVSKRSDQWVRGHLRKISYPLLLFIITGCCTPHTPIDLPPRPVLIDWPQEVLDRTPLEAQDIASHNDLAVKEYARKLEERIRLHNEAMQ